MAMPVPAQAIDAIKGVFVECGISKTCNLRNCFCRKTCEIRCTSAEWKFAENVTTTVEEATGHLR